MTKFRSNDDDIFARRPLAELRARLDRHTLAAEADVAGQEAFMEAAIAAAMIIAHADGEADDAERRRIVSLFRTNPMLQGFSTDDVAREIEAHTHAFAADRDSALGRARAYIVTADLTNPQFRSLIQICMSVLEADGIRHSFEEEALAEVASMRPWGYR
ncbi:MULTISPECIES: TerB family tellurite resistance protein [Hyphomicrobiales]|jgi:tellurite resistance protein|uniref:Co-chaperone DjlA N-terminal domain-containing protein n=1 Tax=Devosia marina TaxID=2683198 RepID=A0A7X3FUU5_9HYPH|nr:MULTISPECIES: TerB family tellurite resistance protein [Hyphomicrobiales]MBO6636150.1 TerB family tellurite resistance protein [Parvibaculum sp.]MBO6728063.1 TerB family tellurite resistance protein [Rhizobiaceae bacterium]MVT01039.1 hypothetical protein [Devosia marina]